MARAMVHYDDADINATGVFWDFQLDSLGIAGFTLANYSRDLEETWQARIREEVKIYIDDTSDTLVFHGIVKNIKSHNDLLIVACGGIFEKLSWASPTINETTNRIATYKIYETPGGSDKELKVINLDDTDTDISLNLFGYYLIATDATLEENNYEYDVDQFESSHIYGTVDLVSGHNWSAGNEDFQINGTTVTLTDNCANISEVVTHVSAKVTAAGLSGYTVTTDGGSSNKLIMYRSDSVPFYLDNGVSDALTTIGWDNFAASLSNLNQNNDSVYEVTTAAIPQDENYTLKMRYKFDITDNAIADTSLINKIKIDLVATAYNFNQSGAGRAIHQIRAYWSHDGTTLDKLLSFRFNATGNADYISIAYQGELTQDDIPSTSTLLASSGGNFSTGYIIFVFYVQYYWVVKLKGSYAHLTVYYDSEDFDTFNQRISSVDASAGNDYSILKCFDDTPTADNFTFGSKGLTAGDTIEIGIDYLTAFTKMAKYGALDINDGDVFDYGTADNFVGLNPYEYLKALCERTAMYHFVEHSGDSALLKVLGLNSSNFNNFASASVTYDNDNDKPSKIVADYDDVNDYDEVKVFYKDGVSVKKEINAGLENPKTKILNMPNIITRAEADRIAEEWKDRLSLAQPGIELTWEVKDPLTNMPKIGYTYNLTYNRGHVNETGTVDLSGGYDFSVANKDFKLDGKTITLDTNCADLAAVVAEIQAEINTVWGSGKYTVSASGSLYVNIVRADGVNFLLETGSADALAVIGWSDQSVSHTNLVCRKTNVRHDGANGIWTIVASFGGGSSPPEEQIGKEIRYLRDRVTSLYSLIMTLQTNNVAAGGATVWTESQSQSACGFSTSTTRNSELNMNSQRLYGLQAADANGEGVRYEQVNNLLSYNDVKDEDNMASDSNTALATQQSIKAYVDANSGGDLVDDLTPQLGGDLDLNGKNIDFPTTANISDCLDEDDMASDSATKICTQQSIKAYVDVHTLIGSANKDWVGCPFQQSNYASKINYGGAIMNADAQDSTWVFVNHLPKTLGSLNLYTDAVRIGVYSADANDYLDRVRVAQRKTSGGVAANTFHDNTTNYTSAQLVTQTFTATSMSGYEELDVGLSVYCTNTNQMGILFVELRCYYA